MSRLDVTRRRTIQLSAKGVAALLAVGPFLHGCAREERAASSFDLLPAGDGGGTPEGQGGNHEPNMAGTGDTSGERGGVMDTAGPANTEPERIDWASFLDAVAELADVQFTLDWDQEAYVEDVARLMRRLNLEDPAIVEAYSHYADEVRGFPEITEIYEEPGFELSTLEFEAGEVIDLHDHPGMTGVILCISGEVEIENFDQLDEISSDGHLLLQRTEQVTLTAGQSATLTAVRGNIHTLRANRFTQLLDVFTPPYDDERIRLSRWFQRTDTPYQNREGIFEAWET